MYGFAARLARDRRAATAIEYGFIVALIAMGIISALSLFASTAVDIWNDVATKFVGG